jgi:hypothetical protein
MRPKSKLSAAIVIGFVALAAALGTLFYCVLRSQETANRVHCNKQMRAIGQALFLYANENRGAYPPDLDRLIVTQDITPAIFICASSDDSPDAAPRPANVDDWAPLSAGHCSYVYLGRGRAVSTAGRDFVLMYEPVTHHKMAHLLFGDGRTEFIPEPKAQRVERELKADLNPPPALATPK